MLFRQFDVPPRTAWVQQEVLSGDSEVARTTVEEYYEEKLLKDHKYFERWGSQDLEGIDIEIEFVQ